MESANSRLRLEEHGQEPSGDTQFLGFPNITANFVYCPNQFLDVCLPHSSRSAVRLVAFVLDQTLGWLGRDGNPISQNITVSYRELIESAGISRGAIRKALDEAIDTHFIRCVREGKASASGQSAEHASYALRWDDGDQYHDTPAGFQGFFAGEGHRTPIPNAFFRRVIPHETLTVTKVVGAVLRNTVGYQTQFGGRRSQAPLSYRFIQAYANIPDPRSLSMAISSAIASKYIVCIKEGSFHSDPAKRKPSTYAINWLSGEQLPTRGSKNPAEDKSKKTSSPPVQKTQQDRFTIPSKDGSENPADKQFKTPSKEKTDQKNTLKQQHHEIDVAANSKGFSLLRDAGFDEKAAMELSTRASVEQIERQIQWLSDRNVNHNRLGMLRRAIVENWPEPVRPKDPRTRHRERRERDLQRALQQERENGESQGSKSQRIQKRAQLLTVWNGLSEVEQQRIESAAYESQQSEVLKRLFRTSEAHRLRECLKHLAQKMTSDDAARTS